MRKNLKTVKATLVMGILLVSVFVAIMPTTSAGILGAFDITQIVTVSPDVSSIEREYTPTRSYIIPLNMTYSVQCMFPDLTLPVLENRVNAYIDLRVEAQQSWFTCTIYPNTVRASVTTTGALVDPAPYIRVTVDESAPARTKGSINVHMTCRGQRGFIVSKLVECETVANVDFTPAYLPIISVNPQGTFKEINPGELAEVPIEFENLGNAKTVVNMEILNIPAGWAVSIPSQVTLGSKLMGDDPKATVILSVQAPYGFGYHNERESIQVRFTPTYYAEQGGEDVTGMPITETINIQSRGFSTPGFEAIYLLSALACIVFIALLKKRSK